MEYHEYANLFPMLPDSELKELANDIAANGLQTPISLYEGKILDGRNRFRACEIASVAAKFEEYTGGDALAFVMSHNLHRRHLNPSQLAMVGAKWAKLKVGHVNTQRVGPPIGGPTTETKTRDEASKLLGVGTSSIDRAKQIITKGANGLADAVESGKISVEAARLVASLPEKDQRDAIDLGIDAIKAAAAAVRKARASEEREHKEPEPLVIDGTASTGADHVKWTPDDAERLWLIAKTDLDKILPNDKNREPVLRKVIAYAQARIDQKK